MCAMLALVAAKELKISRRRCLQFLEAYIGKLECFPGVIACLTSTRTADAFSTAYLCCISAQIRQF